MNITEGIFTGTYMYHCKYLRLRVGEQVACVRLLMYIDISEAAKCTTCRYCVNHEPNSRYMYICYTCNREKDRTVVRCLRRGNIVSVCLVDKLHRHTCTHFIQCRVLNILCI